MTDNALEYNPVEPMSDEKKLEVTLHNLSNAESKIKDLKRRVKELTKVVTDRLFIENVIYYDIFECKNKKLVIKDSVYINDRGLRILVELPESVQKRVKDNEQ